MWKTVFRPGMIALSLAAQLAGASAADLGFGSAPLVAEPVVAIPVLPHIWLGHFTGGRNLAPGLQPLALDWRDEFARFPSRGACLHWLRALKAAYHDYQGYKTCLPIR